MTTSIELEGGQVIFSDGTAITRDATWERIWDREENVTTLTGSATGVNRNGEAYRAEIVEEFVFARDCWLGRVFIPVSGVKTFTVEDQITTIDYGEGACDNLATVTKDGVSEEIIVSLRGRRRG